MFAPERIPGRKSPLFTGHLTIVNENDAGNDVVFDVVDIFLFGMDRKHKYHPQLPACQMLEPFRQRWICGFTQRAFVHPDERFRASLAANCQNITPNKRHTYGASSECFSNVNVLKQILSVSTSTV